jgi:hypothetical protein
MPETHVPLREPLAPLGAVVVLPLPLAAGALLPPPLLVLPPPAPAPANKAQEAIENPITAISAIAVIVAALRAALSFAAVKLSLFVFLFFIKLSLLSRVSGDVNWMAPQRGDKHSFLSRVSGDIKLDGSATRRQKLLIKPRERRC